MDVIAWIPDCAGQAADAVSADTQVRMEDAPKLRSTFRSQSVQISGYVYHDTSSPNHGPPLKNRLFLLNKMDTVTHVPAYCGKDNLKKFCWKMGGRKYQTGNACLCIVSKFFSCPCTWMTSKWLERSKNSISSFVAYVYLGCIQRECNPNLSIC